MIQTTLNEKIKQKHQDAYQNLANAISLILNHNKDGLSLYDLIKQLSSDPYHLLDDRALREPVTLFQTNFVVMNALYQLKKHSTQFDFSISPLEIKQFPKSVSSSTHLIIEDKLADYYLNWDNIHQTEAEINDLLSSFWEKILVIDFKEEDLKVLGIEHAMTLQEIKKQYRYLSQQHHPDKGGDPEAFLKIKLAYERLMKQYKP